MEVLQSLPQLEAMCERLYHAQSQQERAQVEQMLGVFSQSTEYIVHLKAILDNSRSPYAQLMASSSMLKLVTEHALSVQVRTEMKAYFLTYLDSNCTSMENFVSASLIQLLCRTVKLGWMDHDSFRTIVDDCKVFLEKGSQAHYLVGLRILNTLVGEMNSATPGRTLTQHRKIAVSFRDTVLFRCFQASLAALADMRAKGADGKLKEQGLSLALQCLSFDFVGTCMDDSSEELWTIQVPSSWRSVIEDATTPQLFMDFYGTTTPPLSSNALECLVRLASVRRSLFASEAERFKFLNRLVAGTRDILRTKQGLQEHENFHELCRLLGRLKTNYQLSELVAVENYTEWIQLVAELTVYALGNWQWAGSSVYYLLGLWGRLVSSMPYLKGDQPSLLETNVPQITQAYITSRLESVRTGQSAGTSDVELLDQEDALAEQLDALPYLLRFQYERSATYLAGLVDPVVEVFKQAASSPLPAQQQAVLEGQLTWLVYIIGAVVKGRLSSAAADAQEVIDGDLAARVFGILRTADEGLHAARYTERSRQRLDIAILHFFQCFRKVYIGEQVMQCTKVYAKLSERLGLDDHLAVLNVMLAKLAKNLQVYGSCEELVHLSLVLFQDLASGYMSGKLLMKLDAVAYLLQHHSSSHYSFLDHPANGRNRTTFYTTLARLLFMEDTPAKFRAFVAPIQTVLANLSEAIRLAPNPQALRQTVPAATVTGLFRDLRGIATATATRRTYGFLFEWLYPQHMPTILACLNAWADMPSVAVPLLKFVSELAFNKSQRVTFDSSSPNGILLFREVSKAVVAYGNRILATPTTRDPYATRYKGIWVCLQALARAMSGSYVNFGVFELYGDPALKDALDVALRMVLSIPLADVLSYRKVAKAYFSLMEVLAGSHTSVLAGQDLSTFMFLMTSLEAGLKSLDVASSSSCASAVDNLVSFYFKHVLAGPDSTASVSGNTTPPAGAQQMADHLRQQPGLLPEILKSLFEIVLFEECTNQWSLSRPMLPLILASEPVYADLRRQLVASQPPERQAHLASCLDKLMVDVQRNLEPKNKDRFTQNLTVLRHEYRSKTT